MGVRPPRVAAEHRPLERLPVHAHRHLALLPERHAHGARRVAGLRDAHLERRALLDPDRRQATPVRVVGPAPDHDPRPPDPPVRVPVDDGDEHLRRLRLRRVRLDPEDGLHDPPGRPGCRVEHGVRDRRARCCQGHDRDRDRACPKEARHASPGSLATGSGRSSANGSKLPAGPEVRHRCEKKRVITTPARKSPSVGSGRSPRASWSASSG